MLRPDVIEGEGIFEVALEGHDQFGLLGLPLAAEEALALDSLVQGRCLPNAGSLGDDLAAVGALVVGGEAGRDGQGVDQVAELVENTALAGDIREKLSQGGDQAAPSIVDEQGEATVGSQATLFQSIEQAQPTGSVFGGLGSDFPIQYAGTSFFGPDAQGDEDR